MSRKKKYRSYTNIKIFSVTFFLWLFLVAIFSDNDLKTGGNLEIGFPLDFYIGYQPLCFECPFVHDMRILNLVADVSLTLLLAFAAMRFMKQSVIRR